MFEYKVVPNDQKTKKTEEMLNDLSTDGWRVIGFGVYQILLEREKDESLEQING